MNSRLPFISACFLFLSTTACEQAVSIQGQVQVPLEVQRLFSRERPGRVVAWWEHGGGPQHLITLCGEDTANLSTPFQITSFGCVWESVVVAMADLVPAASVATVTCGGVDSTTGGALRTDALAEAEAIVFAGKKSGSCRSGETTVSLTLAVKP